MSKITKEESLNLKKLLNNNSDAVDNTEYIRRVRHSNKMNHDIKALERLKKSQAKLYLENREHFKEKAQMVANFLFVNYTDIFNKIITNELDLNIMTRLLSVFKMIEDNQVDQHEASVLVGKILKELYVDSALKKCNNLDKENELNEDKKETRDVKPISWSEWKNNNV